MEVATADKIKDFQVVYDTYFAPLVNFLYYHTGDAEQANDFAQEAYARLWTNFEKVEPGKAKSYLFTIAKRLFLDEAGRDKVRMKFRYRNQYKESQMDTNPEHLYRENEFKNRLEAAVENLTPQRRTIFLMSRIDKFKNREIAELLNISIKTVEKHIAIALRELREQLDELANLRI